MQQSQGVELEMVASFRQNSYVWDAMVDQWAASRTSRDSYQWKLGTNLDFDIHKVQHDTILATSKCGLPEHSSEVEPRPHTTQLLVKQIQNLNSRDEHKLQIP